MLSAPHFINRKFEKALFRRMLTGNIERRILAIFEEGERGKSYFLWHLRDICKSEGIPVSLLDFHPEHGLTNFLQVAHQFCNELGDLRFPSYQSQLKSYLSPALVHVQSESRGGVDFGSESDFSSAKIENITGGNRINIGDTVLVESDVSSRYRQVAVMNILGQSIKDDLARFCNESQPVVVLIDTFERVPEETRIWLISWLFRPLVESFPRLVLVVVARPEAQVVTTLEGSSPWQHLLHPIHNFSSFTLEDIHQYFKLRHIPIPKDALKYLYPIFKNEPLRFCSIADALEMEVRSAR
ncbi:MAG: hypothetical protein HYZ24_14830 [Chloroflexi bacterium]|nr:hypothetical protein [Chloroflexota bacterium]